MNVISMKKVNSIPVIRRKRIEQRRDARIRKEEINSLEQVETLPDSSHLDSTQDFLMNILTFDHCQKGQRSQRTKRLDYNTLKPLLSEDTASASTTVTGPELDPIDTETPPKYMSKAEKILARQRLIDEAFEKNHLSGLTASDLAIKVRSLAIKSLNRLSVCQLAIAKVKREYDEEYHNEFSANLAKWTYYMKIITRNLRISGEDPKSYSMESLMEMAQIYEQERKLVDLNRDRQDLITRRETYRKQHKHKENQAIKAFREHFKKIGFVLNSTPIEEIEVLSRGFELEEMTPAAFTRYLIRYIGSLPGGKVKSKVFQRARRNYHAQIKQKEARLAKLNFSNA